MELSGNVVLALAMMTGLWVTLVSLHLSDRSIADARSALLAERAQYPSQVPAARQIRIMAAAPALEETEGWMGFRSSIDGFNVNQNPTTGPGGAQDHQDPVAYYAGKWPSGTGATMSKPNNVLGAGGSAYQAPGRDSHWWSSAGSNSKGADSHSGNWQRAVVGRFALASPSVQLAGEGYPYDSPASWDSDPKHGFGGHAGGSNAGALNVAEASNPGGSYYCPDCTW